MGASLDKPLRDTTCEELAVLCEKLSTPPIVQTVVSEKSIDGATVLELDEETIKSLGKTLLEKKQLLGAFHKCVAETVTLPPLIRSSQALRARGEKRASPHRMLDRDDNLVFGDEQLPQKIKIDVNDEFDEILRSMREYPSNPEVQQYGAKQLGTLADFEKVYEPERVKFNQRKAGQLGAIQAVVSGMHNCPGEKRVQTDAAYAIACLIDGHEGNREVALEHGAVKYLQDAMDTFRHEDDLIEHCSAALRVLLGDEEFSQQTKGREKDDFGVLSLLKTMLDAPENKGVQERGCWAVSTLAADSTIAIHQQILDGNGPAALVYALETYGMQSTQDTELAQHAVHAFVNLAKLRMNRKSLHKVGAMNLVKNVIQFHHRHSKPIFLSGCLFFELMSNKKVYRDEAYKIQGVQAITMMLSFYFQEHLEKNVNLSSSSPVKASMNVFERALRTLGNIVLNHEGNQSAMCNTTGGIELLKNIMEAFPGSENIQKYATIVFGIIGRVDGFEEAVGAVALPCVLNAMSAFPAAAPLQQGGCMLLYYVLTARQHALDSDGNSSLGTSRTSSSRPSTSREEGPRALTKPKPPQFTASIFESENMYKEATKVVLVACDVHRKDPLVILWGSRALGLSVEFPSGRTVCTEMNGTASILMGMDMFPRNVKVQQMGCHALSRIVSNHPENRCKVKQQGGIRKVISAMVVFKAHAGVQQAGCDALGNLASGPTPANQDAIYEQGGLEAIFAAMQDLPDEATVQQVACQALYFLVWENARIMEDIVNCDGAAAMENALKAHRWHAGVQYWGSNALALFNAVEDGKSTGRSENESRDGASESSTVLGNEKTEQQLSAAAPPPLQGLNSIDTSATVSGGKKKWSKPRRIDGAPQPTSVMMVNIDGMWVDSRGIK